MKWGETPYFLSGRIVKKSHYQGRELSDPDLPDQKNETPSHEVLFLDEMFADPFESSGLFFQEDNLALIFRDSIRRSSEAAPVPGEVLRPVPFEDLEVAILSNEGGHAAFHEIFSDDKEKDSYWVFTSPELGIKNQAIPLIHVSEAYSNWQTFEKCPPILQVHLCIMTGETIKRRPDHNYRFSFEIMKTGLAKALKQKESDISPEIFVEVMNGIERGLKVGDRQSLEILGNMVWYYEGVMEDLMEKAQKRFAKAV